jgi:hypothetical protein
VGGPANLLNHFLEKVSRHLKNVLRVEKKPAFLRAEIAKKLMNSSTLPTIQQSNLRWNVWLMSGRSARSPQYGKHAESM